MRRAAGAVGRRAGAAPLRSLCSQLSIDRTGQIQTQSKAAVRLRRGAAPGAPPPRLPPPSFAVLENPDAREVELKSESFVEKTLRRFRKRFLGKVERPPVNGQEALAAHVGEGAQRFFGRR